jgi:hypothetical protein
VTPGEGNSTLFMLSDGPAGIPPITWPTQGGLVAIDQSPRLPSTLGTAPFLVDIQGCVGIEKRLHFHGLRNTCASELLEKGLTVAGQGLASSHPPGGNGQVSEELIEKGRQRQW